jgi:hypothetical protein
MMFVALDEYDLQALWFGDCAALVERPGETVHVIGEALQKRSRERERAAALASKLGANSAAKGVRDVFLPALRRARNHVNTEAGGWLFGPDSRAASHVSVAHMPAPRDTTILLVSDGFLVLASDYERYTVESLFQAAQSRGLAALGDEVRAIEENDPDGVRYPRFKKSDDATALLLRVA